MEGLHPHSWHSLSNSKIESYVVPLFSSLLILHRKASTNSVKDSYKNTMIIPRGTEGQGRLK